MRTVRPMILPIGNKLLLSVRWTTAGCFAAKRGNAFTFLEVMVSLVILSVGITGIYRAFLTALNYQRYVLTKLYTVNVLSDEFARAEHPLVQGGQMPSLAQQEVWIPSDPSSRFFIQRVIVPPRVGYDGEWELQVRMIWQDGEKSQEYRKGSLVYVDGLE